jgi:hypothetical protein
MSKEKIFADVTISWPDSDGHEVKFTIGFWTLYRDRCLIEGQARILAKNAIDNYADVEVVSVVKSGGIPVTLVGE